MDIHAPRTNRGESPDEQDARQAESEACTYVLSTAPGEHVRPRDLQAVTKGTLSFNAACRVLEGLERDGELVRTTDPTYAGMLVWMRAQPATPPAQGYALPLSPREHGALMRLLDWKLSGDGQGQGPNDSDLLRAIRGKLKRPA